MLLLGEEEEEEAEARARELLFADARAKKTKDGAKPEAPRTQLQCRALGAQQALADAALGAAAAGAAGGAGAGAGRYKMDVWANRGPSASGAAEALAVEALRQVRCGKRAL